MHDSGSQISSDDIKQNRYWKVLLVLDPEIFRICSPREINIKNCTFNCNKSKDLRIRNKAIEAETVLKDSSSHVELVETKMNSCRSTLKRINNRIIVSQKKRNKTMKTKILFGHLISVWHWWQLTIIYDNCEVFKI